MDYPILYRDRVIFPMKNVFEFGMSIRTKFYGQLLLGGVRIGK